MTRRSSSCGRPRPSPRPGSAEGRPAPTSRARGLGARGRALALLIALAAGALAAPAWAQRGDARLGRARALADEAWQDIQAGRPREAIPKAREALALREQALGASHPAVAQGLHTLARGLADAGDPAAARPLIERALTIRERAFGADHPLVAQSLNHLGIVAALLGDHPAALAAHRRALALRERAFGPDHPEVAQSLNNLAWVEVATGDLAAARPRYERALAIREQALGPAHPDVATTLDDLGSLLRQADDLAAARARVERGLGIRESAFGPDHPLVAQSLYNLGWVLYASGEYAGARQAHERALRIRQQALGSGHPQAARSLNGLGVVLWITGDYPRARAVYEQALHIRVQALGPDHPEVAGVLANLGMLLRTVGEYAAARSALERALKINEQAFGPDDRSVAQPLYFLALVYESTGDHASARARADRALAIRERTLGPDHRDVALSLWSVARLRAASGDHAGARPLLERALRINERNLGPDHRNVAGVLIDLGRVTRLTGDRARARQIFEQSLAIQERALGPDHPEVARTLDNLAYLVLAAGDTAAAQAMFERMRAIARQTGVADTGWRAAAGLGRIRERESNWTEALALYREAVKALEEQAGRFDDEAQRAQFLQAGNRLSAYDALARVLLRLHERDSSQGYDREAWAVLDAKKKRVAAETLTAARPAPRDPGARAEMESAQSKRDHALALERTLLEEQAKAAPEQQPEKIRNLTTLLAQTKAEYLAQVQRFLQRYPRYKSQFVDQQTVDPKALAKFADRLPADTLAVQYFAAPERLYIFLVARGGKFQVKSRDVAQADLFRLVKEYRELVERGVGRALPWNDDGSEAYRRDVLPLKALTRELSGHLLRPIEAELARGRGLIVIPNDLLLYLPVHALTREGPDGSARFLAETHAVSYVTQLELTDLLAPGTATPDAPLLAVANPDGTLPAASREIRALGRIRRAMTALEGPQATKAGFLREVGRFSDLHLATHGVLDPERPERSYLLLAGEDESSQRLGIDEIAGLSLPAGLTILSACETALGEQVPGAALITLAAAFSQAGAQSIVASLWRVNDAATRDFMVALHGSLAAGRAAALQKAQRALLASPAKAHPFYWAAFILIGAR
jgi:tetratricopeptide (TPR) repeat protein